MLPLIHDYLRTLWNCVYSAGGGGEVLLPGLRLCRGDDS